MEMSIKKEDFNKTSETLRTNKIRTYNLSRYTKSIIILRNSLRFIVWHNLTLILDIKSVQNKFLHSIRIKIQISDWKSLLNPLSLSRSKIVFDETRWNSHEEETSAAKNETK